jgi:hypothetical protein
VGRAVLVVSALLVGLGACTAVLGIKPDRYLAADDSGAAGDDVDMLADVTDAPDASAGPWSCLDQPAPDASGGNVEMRFSVTDIGTASAGYTGKPYPGATISSCTQIDFGCMNPVSAATTDDAGIAVLTVPLGFDGYYELLGASSYEPQLIERMRQSGGERADMSMISMQEVSGGAALLGVSPDPSLAVVILSAFDCNMASVAGIAFDVGTLAPNEHMAYLINKVPSASATQTDQTGSAIIYNVPPGSLAVSATQVATARVIASRNGLVQKGWLTLVQLRPPQAQFPAP